MGAWRFLSAVSFALVLANPQVCTAEPLYEAIPAFHAYLIGDVKGHVIAENQSLANGVPGSALKVVTALLAYQALGADYTFKTTLSLTHRAGTMRDGVLRGSGDPTLTSQDLEKLFEPLKGQSFPGTLYVDLSPYQLPEYSTNIMGYDLGSFDARPLSALNVDGNLFNLRLTATRGKVQAIDDFGKKPLVQVTLHEGPTQLASLWSPEGLKIMGKMNAQEASALRPVAPHRQAPYLTEKLKAVLKKLHIKATVKLTKDPQPLPSGQVLFATHESRPLKEFLPPALKRSDNFIFEALYLRMIHDHTLTPLRDWHEGGPVIKELAKKYFQVNLEQALLVDGSGISHHNQLSPRAFYELLRAGASIPEFVAALPYPGEPLSTLKNRKELPAHLRAKTGSLLGVVTLCGYGVNDQGTPTHAFTLMSNHASGAPALLYHAQETLLKKYLSP